MIVVDTSVWIDYLRGVENAHTVLLDGLLGTESVALTDLILCEVLQGISDDSQFRRVNSELHEFYILDSGGEATAIQAARNYRDLRGRGVTVRKTVDCLIATFCIKDGHTLLHRDRDFDAFEQHLALNVLHPPRLN